MDIKAKHAIICVGKCIIFLSIFIMLCILFSKIVMPVRMDWSSFDSTHGFYEEPDNTIEVLFIGPSNVVNSIIPIELYDQFGIAAFNLSQCAQPTSISYYWLEEAYLHHSKSLKTVVFDVSMIKRIPEFYLYQEAFDYVENPSIKLKMILSSNVNQCNEVISYMFPLFEYHERWKELNM